MTTRLWSFIGSSDAGDWQVAEKTTIKGDDPLPPTARVLTVALDPPAAPSSSGGGWVLRGVTSNERYVTKDEKAGLVAKQAGIGRGGCNRAAVILIRKSPAW